MNKIILAAALLAPLAAAPAFAQVEATQRNSVTQYQTQSPREFTARRAYQAPVAVERADVQSDRQGPSGNF
ncbi:MAG: hypothetical protein Q8O26_13325 [Phreatobacter sp.]|uniref:hypothetical protein n=1 Tax=Phreatobacter sp. TaxID=1966341 RepID=UPI0027340A01|nr:hypothetical protein [Phreatobacter sp.]MDP2802857.1 hypothetical protein [Phreatobacter sp.]